MARATKTGEGSASAPQRRPCPAPRADWASRRAPPGSGPTGPPCRRWAGHALPPRRRPVPHVPAGAGAAEALRRLRRLAGSPRPRRVALLDWQGAHPRSGSSSAWCSARTRPGRASSGPPHPGPPRDPAGEPLSRRRSASRHAASRTPCGRSRRGPSSRSSGARVVHPGRAAGPAGRDHHPRPASRRRADHALRPAQARRLLQGEGPANEKHYIVRHGDSLRAISARFHRVRCVLEAHPAPQPADGEVRGDPRPEVPCAPGTASGSPDALVLIRMPEQAAALAAGTPAMPPRMSRRGPPPLRPGPRGGGCGRSHRRPARPDH